MDRLRQASGSYGTLQLTYDDVGNRLSKSGTPGATTYSYDASTNRLASASSVEPASFSYDQNGNTVQDGAGLYTHTPVNQVESATVDGVVTSYRYDADDLRKIKARAGETRYYIHGPGGQILSEFVEQGGHHELVRDYVYAGSRLLASAGTLLAVHPSVVFAPSSCPSPLFSPSWSTWRGLRLGLGLAAVPVAFHGRGRDGGRAPAALRDDQPLALGSYPASLQPSSPTGLVQPERSPSRRRARSSRAARRPREPLALPVFGRSQPAYQACSWPTPAKPRWPGQPPPAPPGSRSLPRAATPRTVTLSVNGAGLAKGTYTDTVLVEAAGIPDGRRTIPVELVWRARAAGVGSGRGLRSFDALALGDVDGQGGWDRIGANATGQVQADPRGPGRVLILEAPDGGFVKDTLAVTPHPIEGSEFSVQVMTRDVRPGSKSVAKIQFLTSPGDGWAKNHRTFATIRVGARMVFQYGHTLSQDLMPMQSGRWYEFLLRYEGGQVHVSVDGQLKFSSGAGSPLGSPSWAAPTPPGRSPAWPASHAAGEEPWADLVRCRARHLSFAAVEGGKCPGPPPSRGSFASRGRRIAPRRGRRARPPQSPWPRARAGSVRTCRWPSSRTSDKPGPGPLSWLAAPR